MRLFKFMLVAFLVSSSFLNALGQQEIDVTKITQYIKQADVKSLSKYFDNNIQLNILDQKNFYSKAQASVILKDFFAKYPPTDFSIQHQGGAEENKFFIGILSSGEESYRVSIHIRLIQKKKVISFLSIEKNKR